MTQNESDKSDVLFFKTQKKVMAKVKMVVM
ncbi:hypothetical protein SAMN04489722_102312 [Algibacter lectus]|nr:hypothetical protein SAMN04489722_102312 [Algibacter lectus]